MTDAGIPDGVTVETIYIVEVSYTSDAPTKRPAVRPEHLARVARLIKEGRLIEAGGFQDFSSALFLVPAADEAEAADLVRDDVYMRGGVWKDDVRARPFGRVVPTTAAPESD
jgi:uncharacterized protein YciI